MACKEREGVVGSEEIRIGIDEVDGMAKDDSTVQTSLTQNIPEGGVISNGQGTCLAEDRDSAEAPPTDHTYHREESLSVPLRRWGGEEEGEGEGEGCSPSPDRRSPFLEREDCVEWEVYGTNTTTASIRHKVFERSVSILPDK